MFYKINSVNHQFETSEYPVPVDNPYFFSNFFSQKVNLNIIKVPFPILKAKANRTDLLNGTCNGQNARLLISDKLKAILEKYHHPGLQFIETHITHKGQIYNNYWFTNHFIFDTDKIDYDKSGIFLFNKLDFGFKFKLAFPNENAFQDYLKKLEFPNTVRIEKPVFKTLNNNLLILYPVNGAVGYYVSEQLKKEIEDAGCTGIDFEEVEQG